jgi:exopolysaccharide biosynthesis protein
MTILDKVAVIIFGLVAITLFIGIGVEQYMLYSCKQTAIKQHFSIIAIQEICR